MSWTAISQIVNQSFWLGSLLVLARLLSPGAFGAVTIGLLLVTAATRVIGSATGGAMIVADRLSRAQITTALKFNIASCLALSAAIALLSMPMANTFAARGDAHVIAALGAGVALYGPAIVPLALLSRGLLFKRRAAVQAGATITASITSVAAALLGAGVWSLVIRQLLYQALLAGLSWVAAHRLLPAKVPSSGRPRWQRLAQRGAIGFVVFSLTDFVVFNTDYLVVGHLTNTTQLGLYSLAYTIAFAPLSQIFVQLGLVLFPAAAASDPDAMRRRTILGVRLTGLVLLPLLPAAFVLAPVVVPSVLGARWRGIVAPLQILLVVCVAHAMVNVIGESLSGTGNIDFRARINVAWMTGMFVALIVLVKADGIKGAALAHLLLYLPVAVAYCVWGLRRLGAQPRELGRALLPVVGAVGFQVVATLGVSVILHGTSLSVGVRAFISAIVGVAAFGCIALKERSALADARSLLRSTRRGD
jgi:O-antigen/teichoic acid export membrane protein